MTEPPHQYEVRWYATFWDERGQQIDRVTLGPGKIPIPLMAMYMTADAEVRAGSEGEAGGVPGCLSAPLKVPCPAPSAPGFPGCSTPSCPAAAAGRQPPLMKLRHRGARLALAFTLPFEARSAARPRRTADAASSGA